MATPDPEDVARLAEVALRIYLAISLGPALVVAVWVVLIKDWGHFQEEMRHNWAWLHPWVQTAAVALSLLLVALAWPHILYRSLRSWLARGKSEPKA